MSEPSRQNNLLGDLEQLPQRATAVLKQLQSSQEQLERAKSDLSSIEAKLVVEQQRLDKLEEKTKHKLAEHNSFIERITQEQLKAEDGLKLIYSKAETAAATLRDLEITTDATRKEIAKRALALDKREEVIERKEKLLKDTEQRVAEFNRFMKL